MFRLRISRKRSYREVGEELDISRERARQIETLAIRKLRST
jgi:DNA-directed RNA polymerase sigma subunit (sigma70/sigma32)